MSEYPKRSKSLAYMNLIIRKIFGLDFTLAEIFEYVELPYWVVADLPSKTQMMQSLNILIKIISIQLQKLSFAGFNVKIWDRFERYMLEFYSF